MNINGKFLLHESQVKSHFSHGEVLKHNLILTLELDTWERAVQDEFENFKLNLSSVQKRQEWKSRKRCGGKLSLSAAAVCGKPSEHEQ